MDDELLKSIIALEKDLQRELDEERRRAAVWCDNEIMGQQSRLDAAKKQLSEQSTYLQHEVGKRLKRRLDRWENEEQDRLARFQAFAETHLSAMVGSMIRSLLPGDERDHRDGES